MSLPEPDESVTDPVARIVEYLDFYRSEIRRKTDGLAFADLRRQVVPSGWTITGLVDHLVHMEQRWIVWGFLGQDVPDPRGDRDGEGRWTSTRNIDEILDAGGRRTAEVASTHDALSIAAETGMFAGEDSAPTLLAILLHVFQEYARHAGHLDIVRELHDGLTGED